MLEWWKEHETESAIGDLLQYHFVDHCICIKSVGTEQWCPRRDCSVYLPENDTVETICFVGYLTARSVWRLCSVGYYDVTWIVMNWEGFGRKRSWPSRDITSAGTWTDRKKLRKLSFRIADVLVYTRTEHFSNTSLETSLFCQNHCVADV
jgi:hypothetical protein